MESILLSLTDDDIIKMIPSLYIVLISWDVDICFKYY